MSSHAGLRIFFGKSSVPNWGADIASVELAGVPSRVSWSGVTTYEGWIAPTASITRQSLNVDPLGNGFFRDEGEARRLALEQLRAHHTTTWTTIRQPAAGLETQSFVVTREPMPIGIVATTIAGLLALIIPILLTLWLKRG